MQLFAAGFELSVYCKLMVKTLLPAISVKQVKTSFNNAKLLAIYQYPITTQLVLLRTLNKLSVLYSV